MQSRPYLFPNGWRRILLVRVLVLVLPIPEMELYCSLCPIWLSLGLAVNKWLNNGAQNDEWLWAEFRVWLTFWGKRISENKALGMKRMEQILTHWWGRALLFIKSEKHGTGNLCSIGPFVCLKVEWVSVCAYGCVYVRGWRGRNSGGKYLTNSFWGFWQWLAVSASFHGL